MGKFCSNCGNELSEGVDFCSKCGENLNAVDTQQAMDINTPQVNSKVKKPRKKHGCLFTLSVVIVLVCLGLIIAGMQSNSFLKSLSVGTDESEYITIEEYNEIQLGSSYDEVRTIVGSDGEVTAESSVGGYSTKIVTWYGNGVAGSSANVTFMNDAVEGKAQVGLK